MDAPDLTTAAELGSRIKETLRTLTRDVELAAHKPVRLDEATQRAIAAFEKLPALDELRFESADEALESDVDSVNTDVELFDQLEDRLRWSIGVVSALSDLPGLDIPNSNALGAVIDHLEEAQSIYEQLRRRDRDGQAPDEAPLAKALDDDDRLNVAAFWNHMKWLDGTQQSDAAERGKLVVQQLATIRGPVDLTLERCADVLCYVGYVEPLDGSVLDWSAAGERDGGHMTVGLMTILQAVEDRVRGCGS